MQVKGIYGFARRSAKIKPDVFPSLQMKQAFIVLYRWPTVCVSDAVRIQMYRLKGASKLFLSCDCEIPLLAPNLVVHIQNNFLTSAYIYTDL